MKIIIDTNEKFSKKERELLSFLLTEDAHELTPEEKEIWQENYLRGNNPKKKYVRIHGMRDELIMKIINDYPGVTIRELANLSGYGESSIGPATVALMKDKKIERSLCMPYQYYLRGNNVDLKETLKNAKKISVLG